MNDIVTAEDVYRHFDVEDAKGLDRHLYKETDCGAWGKVSTQNVVEKKTGTWSAEYARGLLGYWHLVKLSGVGDLAGVEPPEDVLRYFWPDVDPLHLQEMLETVLETPGLVAAPYEAEVEWYVKTGELVVFRVGSIVEGTDEEALTVSVYLPCSAQDLDDAIEAVEQDVSRIWNSTHGCQECAKRNEEEWPGCAVDPECPECEGQGTII